MRVCTYYYTHTYYYNKMSHIIDRDSAKLYFLQRKCSSFSVLLQIARYIRATTAKTPSARRTVTPAPAPAPPAPAVRRDIQDIRNVATIRRRIISPIGQFIGGPQPAIDGGESIGHRSVEGGCTQSAHPFLSGQPAPPSADASGSVPRSGADKGRHTAAAESTTANPQTILARVIRQGRQIGRRHWHGRSSDTKKELSMR